MQVKQAETMQQGTRPQAKIIRPTSKNQLQATSNCLPIGTHVMYNITLSKFWHPAVITNILQDSWSYSMTPDEARFRYAKFHLKPYKAYKLPTRQETQLSTQNPCHI